MKRGNMYTQTDLLNAMEKEPSLTDFGMNIHHQYNKLSVDERKEQFNNERQALANNLKQFQLCCQWLEMCEPVKTINRDISSYGLKHKVEKHFGEYVTNGAFIAAVIHLGIPYKTWPNFPNVHIAISKRSLKLLNKW